MTAPVLGNIVPAKFILNLYEDKFFSCEEIVSRINAVFHVAVTRQAIWHFLRKLKRNRRHPDAMRLRVVTGRMNYNDRKFDYKNRKIDFGEIAKKKKMGDASKLKHPKTKMVSLSKNEEAFLMNFCERYKVTRHEALRILCFPNSKYKRFILQKTKLVWSGF